MTIKPSFYSASNSGLIRLLLIFCSIFSTCSTDKKPPDLKKDEETLRHADASIQNAIRQKNVDSLMLYYAEDAVLLPTAEPKVEGKAAIKKEWQHIFEIPDFLNESNLSKIEISDDASMAYTMGSYVATMQGEDGKQVKEPGKWITIWKKQPHNRWRIIVDTYNTDIPPPDHK